ncbi:tRNA dihydrouridine synthase DusB [Actinomycetota bacterium]|nr:tRNA dihydrouridine synthase DusB [Actinomycetota bacterium]
MLLDDSQCIANENSIIPGLFVDEMVSARALSGHIAKVQRKIQFGEHEKFRSLQFYVLDPEHSYKAAKQVAEQNIADHIDLNFGCSVKKVMKTGGGASITVEPDLLREIVRAVVAGVKDAGSSIPVSAKFRLGLDDDDLNYLQTAQIAVEEGCQLLTLHARTAKQFYSGSADWSHIKTLRSETPDSVLVFANGDIWGVQDAARCLEFTGADGVAIGRGCMGRPWIFRELKHFFETGSAVAIRPSLGDVVDIMLRHAELTVQWTSKQHEFSPAEPTAADGYETKAIKAFRANLGPYLKGFPVKQFKLDIMRATTLDELTRALGRLDRSAQYAPEIENAPRGRTKAQKKVYLPNR